MLLQQLLVAVQLTAEDGCRFFIHLMGFIRPESNGHIKSRSAFFPLIV